MTPISWLLVITGVTLLILLLAVFGFIDLVTQLTVDPGAAFFIGLALGLVIGQAIRRFGD